MYTVGAKVLGPLSFGERYSSDRKLFFSGYLSRIATNEIKWEVQIFVYDTIFLLIRPEYLFSRKGHLT